MHHAPPPPPKEPSNWPGVVMGLISESVWLLVWSLPLRHRPTLVILGFCAGCVLAVWILKP